MKRWTAAPTPSQVPANSERWAWVEAAAITKPVRVLRVYPGLSARERIDRAFIQLFVTPRSDDE